MEKIWNNFSLKKPPLITIKATHTKFVPHIYNAIEKYFIRYRRYEITFVETAALLSRLIARRENSLRRMRSFKDVKRIDAALRRLLRLEFHNDLNDFHMSLPDDISADDVKIHLPSRKFFEYLLLRIIVINELYRRIRDCCESAGYYISWQIRHLWFFEFSNLLFAVVAKLYSLSGEMSMIIADLYKELIFYRFQLPSNENSTSLTSNENDLELNSISELKVECNQESTYTKLILEDNVSYNSGQKVQVTAKRHKKKDFGSIVERIELNENINVDEHLTSLEKARRFIINETKKRKESLETCATKNMPQHQWLGAIKLFEKNIRNSKTEKALYILHKQINSKIY